MVAAGNVTSYQADHRTESDTTPVADHAQAWNAVTVAAHTNLTAVSDDPVYHAWIARAREGELSPRCRTSLLFDQHRWPIKPDICTEGGNVLTPTPRAGPTTAGWALVQTGRPGWSAAPSIWLPWNLHAVLSPETSSLQEVTRPAMHSSLKASDNCKPASSSLLPGRSVPRTKTPPWQGRRLLLKGG